MLYSLDRFEGGIAVLTDDGGDSLNVERGLLPADAAPGDMLRREEAGFVHDREATDARRARVLALQNRLRRRSAD